MTLKKKKKKKKEKKKMAHLRKKPYSP